MEPLFVGDSQQQIRMARLVKWAPACEILSAQLRANVLDGKRRVWIVARKVAALKRALEQFHRGPPIGNSRGTGTKGIAESRRAVNF